MGDRRRVPGTASRRPRGDSLMPYEAIKKAAETIAERSGRSEHKVAVVLGSGLGEYASTLPGAVAIPYTDIPGWPIPTVEGHHGTLYSADVHGPVLVLSGRAHCLRGQGLDHARRPSTGFHGGPRRWELAIPGCPCMGLRLLRGVSTRTRLGPSRARPQLCVRCDRNARQ